MNKKLTTLFVFLTLTSFLFQDAAFVRAAEAIDFAQAASLLNSVSGLLQGIKNSEPSTSSAQTAGLLSALQGILNGISNLFVLSSATGISNSQNIPQSVKAAGDPALQPLLQQSSFSYLGAFKLPPTKLGSTYGFGAAGTGGLGAYAVTYNPASNSLFIGGHPYEQKIAEIAIPVSLAGTPTATALTNLKDPLEGKLGSINPSDTNAKVLGSALVYNGQLYVGAYSYYDGAGTQTKSEFVRPLNLNTTGQVIGPVKIGNNYPGWVDKYASLIPSEWQALFEGPAFAGGSGGAINALQSWGPSATVFNPADVNASLSNVAGTLVLGYPYGTPLASTSIGNQYWSEADIVSGMAFIAGTRTVLYFGYHGLGDYCYGTGGVNGDCYDPDNSSKGTHAYPYRSQVWAYDANDLIAVKNGQKQSHQVQPYAVWELDASFKEIQGVGYDPVTQRLYVSQVYADNTQPLIRVYQIDVAPVVLPPPDTTAPSVSITAPANGATVSGSSVTVSANASDNVGVAGVQFKLDGVNLGTEDLLLPYSVSWNTTVASNGSHQLIAVARDAAGNSANSGTVTVTVNNIVPDTTLPSAPTNLSASVISTSQINLSWTASTDNVAVTGYRVDRCPGSGCVNFTQVAAPLTNAHSDTGLSSSTAYSYRVRAIDLAGNLSSYSTIATAITQTPPDATAPAVSLTAPAAGTTVANTATISANASDNIGVDKVEFFVDGALKGTDSASPYSINWDTTNGGAHACSGAHTHSLTTKAYDAASNSVISGAVVVNMNSPSYCADTTAPAVSIASPAANTTASGSITISATASDATGVTGVQFKIDGANIGNEDTASPYSISWDTAPVSNGAHTVTAVARDAAGNTATSLPVAVVVFNALRDTILPSISVSTPSNNATVSGIVTLSANASDNIRVVGVQFRIDGINIASDDTLAPYTYSWDSTQASNGPHAIEAIARDPSGNSNVSSAVNITVSNQVVQCVDSDGDGVLDFNAASCISGIDKCVVAKSALTQQQLTQYYPTSSTFQLTYNQSGDPRSMSNFIISKPNAAQIQFLDSPDLLRKTADGCFEKITIDTTVAELSSNRIKINSATAPELNKRARITFSGVNLANPVIKKDGVVCQQCVLVSNDGGSVVVEVPGFSEYTIEEGASGSASGGGSVSGGAEPAYSGAPVAQDNTAEIQRLLAEIDRLKALIELFKEINRLKLLIAQFQ